MMGDNRIRFTDAAENMIARAYLGGRWYTFDPRNNMPRIGRVLIAQGRDAADVPITHTFGPNTLVSFKVWTDEVS
jgi:transglutaminase-like putative cysteine protease